MRGYRLVIFPINTALFCQDDGDHEKLFVGRRCLDTALKELKGLDASLRIALMHHPLEFLSGLERQHIRAGLIDELDVVLTGHLHEAGVAGIQMGTGRNLRCAAGATYQTRDWPNTAYYATFEGDHVRIFPIYYVDVPRELWTLDTSLYPYEPGYEMRFPVPREPNFRSFRLPGWDGMYRAPSPKIGHETRPAAASAPRPSPGRGVKLIRAAGEDFPAGKRRRSRKATNNTQTRDKRKARPGTNL